ncbi:MAG: flagellar hook assembly protein FlgD [bacterium]
MSTNAITGLGATYTTATSDLKLGSDVVSRDDFLNLLVAQLQHQDPLNPMENEQFVAELATFSSLEQQTNQTELLEQLLASQQGGVNSQALSLIGQDVVAASDSFQYVSGDQPSFLFQATASGDVTVTITNQSGAVVRTDTIPVTSAGNQIYEFDGLHQNGSELAPGSYNISIGSKTNSDGDTLGYPVYLTGQVDEVMFSEGVPIIMIGNQAVDMSQILSVRHRGETDDAAA